MLSKGLSLQFFYTITPVGVEGRVGAVHLSCRNLAFSAPGQRWCAGDAPAQHC